MNHQAPSPVSRRLVLFPARDSPATRRCKGLLVGLVLLAALCLGWPVYPWFGGIYPLILGLPLAFAWAVFWLLAVFLGLVWLYWSEGRSEGRSESRSQGRQESRGA